MKTQAYAKLNVLDTFYCFMFCGNECPPTFGIILGSLKILAPVLYIYIYINPVFVFLLCFFAKGRVVKSDF